MNLRPNLELDSMHGTTDLRPKPGGTNSDECMTLQLSQDLHGGLDIKDELAAQAWAHQPTLMSYLAPQDLLGRLDAMDELAAQSWARLSARDDGCAAQVWAHQL